MAEDLPAPNTDAGALTRLLLVETIAPHDRRYNRAESIKAMRLMRRVIENRLASPSRYSAAGAENDQDIVRLGNQFAGFRDYPTLTAGLTSEINRLLAAKQHGDAAVEQFIADAITAATEADPEPAYRQVTGWRTAGSTSPGPGFLFVTSLQGNDFYELNPVPPVRHRHRSAGPYRHTH